jgi:hypothetical protein
MSPKVYPARIFLSQKKYTENCTDMNIKMDMSAAHVNRGISPDSTFAGFEDHQKRLGVKLFQNEYSWLG